MLSVLDGRLESVWTAEGLCVFVTAREVVSVRSVGEESGDFETLDVG